MLNSGTMESEKSEREEYSEEEECTDAGKVDSQKATGKNKRGRPRKNAEKTEKASRENKIDSFLVRTSVETGDKTNADIYLVLKGLVEEIKDMKEQMKNNDKNFMAETREIKREMKEKENIWANEKIELVKKIGDLENRVGRIECKANDRPNADVEIKLQKVERIIEMQEKRDKINNIIIKGAKINNENVKEQVEQLLDSKLGVKSKIVWAAHRGYNENIIVARLENLEMKKEIFTNKAKLRGSDIFIEEDMTRTEREIQRRVVAAAREERKKGKVVKIGFHKISVDGKWYNWHQDRQTDNSRPDFFIKAFEAGG